MPAPAVPLMVAGLVLSALLPGSLPGSPPGAPPGSLPGSVPGSVPGEPRSASPEPVRRGGPGVALDESSTPTPARGAWPLQPAPAVARPFDPPAQRWSAGHRGVDLLGRPGQPVHAALAGTVSYVGTIAGRGVVTVDHGRVRTTYQPVAATVRRGQRVTRGQVLGRLLLAGSHCAPVACLHWGLVRGDTYLDPLTLVGAVPRPVRLYPW